MTLETGNSKYFTYLQQNANLVRQSTLITEWQENILSFSVYHEKSNTILFSGVSTQFIDFFDFTAYQFEKLIEDEPIFSFSFQHHLVLINLPEFTVVPTEYFRPEESEKILNQNIQLPSGKLRILNKPVLEYQYLFAVPNNFHQVMKSKFLNFSIQPIWIKLLQHQTVGNSLNLHVATNNIWLTYFNDNKLCFFNSFEYQSAEDLLYNVLNVLQQLNLQNDKETLILSGKISKESETYSLLNQYVGGLKFLNKPAKLSYQSNLIDLETNEFNHHYYTIL